MSEEFVSIPVEYIITTNSDWTAFHIVEGGLWGNVKIECLKGCDKIRLQRVIDNKTIEITKRPRNTDLVEVKAKCTLNIDKKYVDSRISHSITKGDLKSTTVRVIVQGKEIVRKTNRFNIRGDRRNTHDFSVSTSRYTSAFKNRKTKIDFDELENVYEGLLKSEKIYLDKIRPWDKLERGALFLFFISIALMLIYSNSAPSNMPMFELLPDYPWQFFLGSITMGLLVLSVVAKGLLDHRNSKIRKELRLNREERIYLLTYEVYKNIISYLKEKNLNRKPFFKKLALMKTDKMMKTVDGWEYGNMSLIRNLVGDKIDFLKDNMKSLVLTNVTQGKEKALRKVSDVLLELCRYIHSPSVERLDKLNDMIRELPYGEYKVLTKTQRLNEYFRGRPRTSRLLFASSISVFVAIVLFCLGQNIGVIFAVFVTCFWGSFMGFDKLFRLEEKEEVERGTGRLSAYVSRPKTPKEEEGEKS